MAFNELRRRRFLGGVTATIAGFAGCGQQQPEDKGTMIENQESSSTDTQTEIPPHDHSGDDAGGTRLGPQSISISEFRGSHSYIIYNRNGETKALSGESQQEEISGSAREVIQSALDRLEKGGSLLLKQGTYVVGPSGLTIPSGVTMLGEGPGVTTIKLREGSAQSGTPVINIGKNRSNITVANIEIDGNAGQQTFDPYPDSPHLHGIVIQGGGPDLPTRQKPANIMIENVTVHDTVRSNIVVAGRHCVLNNLRLSNSVTDHWLYLAGAEGCQITNVHASGYARGDGIVFGVGSRPCFGNLVSGVVIENAEETPIQNEPSGLLGRYPKTAVIFRSGKTFHSNRLRDIHIHNSKPGLGHEIGIFHQDVTVEGLTYRDELGTGPVIRVDRDAEGSKVENARIRLRRGRDNTGSNPVILSKSPEVTFSDIHIEDKSSAANQGFCISGVERSVNGNTIRDSIVACNGPVLKVDGEQNPVNSLYVENIQSQTGIDVVTTGETNFIKRGVY